MELCGVVLVEGTSDCLAVETLARRRGRDLEAEGLAVVPMGGYGNLPRVLAQYRDVPRAGLYDAGEERHFLRALRCDDRDELERAGFYACTRDLEDELTRAVGPAGMERVLGEHGELRAFRTYQKQPAHRARPLEEQLHGFMWNRKQKYAVLLVEALDLERVPRPLDRVLAQFSLRARTPHIALTATVWHRLQRVATSLGSQLSAAIEAQDATAIARCFADDVEFRGLTPRGLKERSGVDQTAALIAAWFAYSTELELVHSESAEIGDKLHLSYRFQGIEEGEPFVVEQSLYCWVEGDRITRADLLCSGFRPRARSL